MSIKKNGFSLIELMIGIVLMSTLLVLGIPSFVDAIERNNLATKTNLMVSALHVARSEAVKRGSTVSVCKTSNGVICSTDNAVGYEDGWIIFVEQPSSVHAIGVRDSANEELLKIQESMNNNYTLRGNDRFVDFVSYLPSGALANADPDADQDHLILCKDGSVDNSKAIFIITTGRVHLARDNDNDNIPEDESGNNLSSCTPS